MCDQVTAGYVTFKITKNIDKNLIILTLIIRKSAKKQNARKILNILYYIEKQMAPYKSTAEKVSFKWSHQRILSTD